MANKRKVKITIKAIKQTIEADSLKEACQLMNIGYQNVLNYRVTHKTTTYENSYIRIEQK